MEAPINFDNRADILKRVSKVGSDSEGGLWKSPFESIDGRWNIANGWECGDKLEEDDKDRYYTRHLIWYRVKAPEITEKFTDFEDKPLTNFMKKTT